MSFRWIFLVTKSTNFVVLRAEGPVGVSVSPVSALGVAVSFVTVNNHLGFLYPPVLFAWVDPTNRRLSVPQPIVVAPVRHGLLRTAQRPRLPLQDRLAARHRPARLQVRTIVAITLKVLAGATRCTWRKCRSRIVETRQSLRSVLRRCVMHLFAIFVPFTLIMLAAMREI